MSFGVHCIGGTNKHGPALYYVLCLNIIVTP
jgi:hypothetical protein